MAARPQLTIEIEGVALHLAHPDEIAIRWIGQQETMKQLLAAWSVVDDADLPMNPRLLGKPGVGKTTLAKLLATEVNLAFVQISAIFTGVADLKKIFEAARLRRQNGRGTLLFVDEIHRFNKSVGLIR